MDSYPEVQQMLESISTALTKFIQTDESHLFPVWTPNPEFSAGSSIRVLQDIRQLRVPRSSIKDAKRVEQINYLLYKLGARQDVDKQLKIEDIVSEPFNMCVSNLIIT
jgi:hypothetical protein